MFTGIQAHTGTHSHRHTCTHVHTGTHAYMYTQHTCTHRHTCTHVHRHACTRMHTCTQAHMHTHMHSHSLSPYHVFPAECTLTCMNGGELHNDSCSCDCRGSLVYGGETCNGKEVDITAGVISSDLYEPLLALVCNCTNGGLCSGQTCICPSAYTGRFCEKPQCIVPCGRNKHPANNCSCGE